MKIRSISRNKRGFLLAEETLKVIISVIAIGFLVYLLTSLYFSSSGQQKKVQASASLERIKEVIDNRNIPQENVTLPNPSGWFVYSFVGEEKPNSCANQNCICICDNAFLGLRNQAKKCAEDGACEIVEDLEPFDSIKILPGGKTSLTIEKFPNKISISEIK